ncbi:hypothetical protein diail_6507 [Diaporthe ilicicola]|nr:hypothetical protein diail_6507 [Diaporthe ilicicola]
MPSRVSGCDTDGGSLPEGMTRIGYDADTETYTFISKDGSIWEGSPGNRYGTITKVCHAPRKLSDDSRMKMESLASSSPAQPDDPTGEPASPGAQKHTDGRRRSASRVLLRCISKVTSSLRPRSGSQASSTAEPSPDALSPDVEDFLFSHIRGQQNQVVPGE